VRELRNYVERCLALRERAPLAPFSGEPEPELVDDSKPYRQARDHWSRVCELRYLQALLSRHDGNVTAAARAAAIDRMYLYRLLWRHRLR
jgi:DNA-binding NtrC family response regulator